MTKPSPFPQTPVSQLHPPTLRTVTTRPFLETVAAVVLTVLTAVLLAGCANVPDSEKDPGRGDGAWIIYSRSGGVAGTYDTVLVTGNGKVIISSPLDKDSVATERQLSVTELATLKKVYASTQWPPNVTTPNPPDGADMYSYSIISDGKTVSYTEGHTPRGVKNLTVLLEKYRSLPGSVIVPSHSDASPSPSPSFANVG